MRRRRGSGPCCRRSPPRLDAEGPRVSAALVLVELGRLHHAIERHERRHHELHVARLPSAILAGHAGGGSALTPPDLGPVAGWAPVVEDPAFEALLRPGAVLRRLATGGTWFEGPVWLPDSDEVIWSDVVGNRPHRWHPDEGQSVFLEGSEHQNG